MTTESNEKDRTPDPLDERWFVVDSEKWAEVVRLLERAPEPKPRLADLLRERGMFASQQLIESGLTREQALVELGFCPNDMDSLPCLTCGAGL